MKIKSVTSLFLLLLFLPFLFPSTIIASTSFIAAICTTGGSVTCLDGVHHLDVAGDGTNIPLATGDIAVVSTSSGVDLIYRYDSTSGLAESDPSVIAPDSLGASSGRWILQKRPLQGGGTNATSASAARTNLGVEIGSQVQAWDEALDDFAALIPEKGAIPYWDSTSTMTRLRSNDSDKQGRVLQATGVNPDTIPEWVDTLNVPKIVFPNSADPVTNTEAQCSWDNDDDMLECYNGATSAIAATLKKCFDPACFYQPDELDSSTEPVAGMFLVKDFPATQFPGGFLITNILVKTSATCTDTIEIEEYYDSSGTWTQDAVVDSITLSGITNEETTISNPNINAGYSVMLDLPSSATDIDWICVTLCGYIKEFD